MHTKKDCLQKETDAQYPALAGHNCFPGIKLLEI